MTGIKIFSIGVFLESSFILAGIYWWFFTDITSFEKTLVLYAAITIVPSWLMMIILLIHFIRKERIAK